MTRHHQRGLTLVELMTGIAVGLAIVAAALLLFTHYLRENRSVLLEARLLQDLRTTADLITRDLRRSGYWGHAGDGVWQPGHAPQVNPYTPLESEDGIRYSYSTDEAEDDAVDPSERFGYRLRAGAIEMQLGDGNWQAMTDPGTMTVQSLELTPSADEVVLTGACAKPCAVDSDTCPPRQQVRSLVLRIAARSSTDATLARSTQTRVRLRNDLLSGGCPP